MDSNRLRLSWIKETSLGVPPGTLRMRTANFTREGLRYVPEFFTPNTIRADRNSTDPTKINEKNMGTVDFEMQYPPDGTPLSDWYSSAFFNAWTNTPARDNDGTADTVITDIGTVSNTVTFTTGAAFVVGHLVRNSGFTAAANNGLFPVTTGGATSYVSTASGFTAEAVPPAAARVKVVGFQGVSGDITATATGLGSTTLNFTTLGLQVGQWIKIGGTGAAFRFTGTAVNNDWCRIIAITATALTLDNRPVGWAIDAGTGKTIRCFFGDVLKNGVTMSSGAFERSFLSQAAPTHILQQGFVANKLTQTIATGQAVTGQFDFMGLTGAQGTVATGSSYDAASTAQVMTSNVSVGRIAEAGVAIASPNWCRGLTINLNNNLRLIEAVGSVGGVSIGVGEFDLTGSVETYFGSNALLTKLMAGTQSALNSRIAINNQAVGWTLPRCTFTDGSPNAGGKNQDLTLPLNFSTSFDSLTSCEAQFERFEYFEA